MKPKFKHDCKHCTFLGGHEEKDEYADLYFCDQLHKLPTVIARFSSEGADYTSGLGSSIPALVEAETIARKRGLL